jgi:hypothetical protein
MLILAALTRGCSRPGAREWRNRQTRTVQVRVSGRTWGFNSPLAHHVCARRSGMIMKGFPCYSTDNPS